MAIDYIHARNEEAYLLRRMFRTGSRHFEQGFRRIILSSISESEEVEGLSTNAKILAKKICGISDIARDIGLVFNGGLKIDIGEVSPDDLSHDISVKIDGEIVCRNAMMFLPTAVFKHHKNVPPLWFLESVFSKQDNLFSKKINYCISDGEIDLVAKAFVGGDNGWISNSIKRSSNAIDEHILSTLHYLQGRKQK